MILGGLVAVNSVGIGISVSEVRVMRVSCCGLCWRGWRGSISWPSVRSICAFFASVFCSFPCRSSFLWWSSHSLAQYPVSWPSDLTACGRLVPATSACVDFFVSVERKDVTEVGRGVFGALFVTLIAASNFAELNVCGEFAAQWLHSAKFFGDGRHCRKTYFLVMALHNMEAESSSKAALLEGPATSLEEQLAEQAASHAAAPWRRAPRR